MGAEILLKMGAEILLGGTDEHPDRGRSAVVGSFGWLPEAEAAASGLGVRWLNSRPGPTR